MKTTMTLSALSIAFAMVGGPIVSAPCTAQNGKLDSVRIDLGPSYPFHGPKFMKARPGPCPGPNPTVKGPLRSR